MGEPSPGPRIGDALGNALLAEWEHGADAGHHAIERDDGFVTCDAASPYFAAWFDVESAARRHIRGRVLDVGAGAGRHSLLLQERGHEVVALDVSPGAVEVCRRRGVRHTVVGTVRDLGSEYNGRFDTVLLFGHNLGLLGSPEGAGDFLEALARLTAPDALVAGTNRDPYATGDPGHLAYHDWNRRRGRMPGHLTLRVRWQDLATDWFDLLYLSLDELDGIVRGRGWSVADRVAVDSSYLAVLRPPGG
jgi:SAM-dependent methyltransferase